MTAIVSFIGWQGSLISTLSVEVVRQLKKRGLRVALIRSVDRHDPRFDQVAGAGGPAQPAEADELMLMSPEQMVLRTATGDLSLTTIAHRYFPDADVVIGEGFEEARQIAKIEVVGDPAQCLRRQVSGVIAVATALDLDADPVFRLDQATEIAEFIQRRFIDDERRRPDITALLVNGRKIALKRFIQESLAGVVSGYVKSLKVNGEIGEIEVRIKL